MRGLLTLAFLLASVAGFCAAREETPTNQAQRIGHRDPAKNLAMGRWRFVSLMGKQIIPTGRQQVYLKFEGRKNTVTGSTGCNRLRGAYRADGTALSIENVTTTKMACAGESYEEDVLEVLRSATGFKIMGHELHLLGPSGELAILIRPHEEKTTQQARPES